MAARLAAARRADDHHAEAHVHRLVQLDLLGDEARHDLQVALERVLDRRLERAVVDGRDVDAREQVADDALEERQVVGEELGQVHVEHRADEHEVLVEIGVGALEPARHHEHRLDRAHAVVVVVLLRELLRAELVHLDHLARGAPWPVAKPSAKRMISPMSA